MFDKVLSKAELSAWQSLKSVVTNFLGNHKSTEYEKEIEDLLKSFCQLGVRMSIKQHFLRSHLGYFPKNWRDLSEEQVEHFCKDIRVIEKRNQGQWGVNFLVDYFWRLKRVVAEHRRKSLKKTFHPRKVSFAYFSV